MGTTHIHSHTLSRTTLPTRLTSTPCPPLRSPPRLKSTLSFPLEALSPGAPSPRTMLSSLPVELSLGAPSPKTIRSRFRRIVPAHYSYPAIRGGSEVACRDVEQNDDIAESRRCVLPWRTRDQRGKTSIIGSINWMSVVMC